MKENSTEIRIHPKTVMKNSLRSLTLLIFRQNKATPKKKNGIMKAPRPKSLEIRRFAHQRPIFPPPFSTVDRELKISFPIMELWSCAQVNT